MRLLGAKQKYSFPLSCSAEWGQSNAAEKRCAPQRLRLGRASGFTMVELLVVIVVSFFVTGAAFALYRTSSQYYVQQDALLEQNQNLRVGLYTVARDVRMAGNCFYLLSPFVSTIQVYSVPDGKWFKYDDTLVTEYGIRAVFGKDGGVSEPDTLTIFRAEVESGSPLGTLASDFSPGSTTIIRLTENFKQNAVKQGDIVALVVGPMAMIVQVDNFNETGDNELIVTNNSRFRPDDPLETPFSGLSFPAGSQVYNLRDVVAVTYYVDTATNCLMASYNDNLVTQMDAGTSVIVATDIEDFQVRYILNNTPMQVNTTPEIWQQGVDGIAENQLGNGNWVAAINLALVSASDRGSSFGDSQPVALFNHTQVATTSDKKQRRILTETISLRNF